MDVSMTGNAQQWSHTGCFDVKIAPAYVSVGDFADSVGDNDMYDGPGLIDKAIGACAAHDPHDFDAACIAGAVFPRELKMSDSRDF